MKRGPKIKLRTKDGETIRENSNYYVVDKLSRFPTIIVVKTEKYLDTYSSRYKFINAKSNVNSGYNLKALRRNDKALIVFASKENAKRYHKRLLQSKIRQASKEFSEYLSSLKKIAAYRL